MSRSIGIVFVAGLATVAGVACGGSSGDDDGTGTGPGAKVLCASSGKNAFETYGTAFVAVDNEIVKETLAAQGTTAGAAGLGSSFAHLGDKSIPALDDDGTTFTGKLGAFLVFAYGGPDHSTIGGSDYDGEQDMVTAHTGLAITSDEFDYFVNMVVVPSLVASKVPMGDITSCFAPVVTDPAFKASIVGK